ncbi:hypothetical protein VTI74DRAFT_2820 [Chaetomium olivicolor]
MGKMIIGQAICQLAITFVLNFGGASLLGYNMADEHEATRLRTLVFNTFVWLQIFNELNNRRLDNRLNIFEGITRNYFFMVINLIMIGGQVLIIFVGGEAFKITKLNGKEWGLSIGLGAISLPWGALIRKFPDAWAEALTPHIPLPNIWPFKKRVARRRARKEQDDVEKALALQQGEEEAARLKMERLRALEESDESDFVAPVPLRTLTSIRGKRVTTHIRRGFREYMHDQKVKVKEKALGGSKVDVSAPGLGGRLAPAAQERRG